MDVGSMRTIHYLYSLMIQRTLKWHVDVGLAESSHLKKIAILIAARRTHVLHSKL